MAIIKFIDANYELVIIDYTYSKDLFKQDVLDYIVYHKSRIVENIHDIKPITFGSSSNQQLHLINMLSYYKGKVIDIRAFENLVKDVVEQTNYYLGKGVNYYDYAYFEMNNYSKEMFIFAKSLEIPIDDVSKIEEWKDGFHIYGMDFIFKQIDTNLSSDFGIYFDGNYYLINVMYI